MAPEWIRWYNTVSYGRTVQTPTTGQNRFWGCFHLSQSTVRLQSLVRFILILMSLYAYIPFPITGNQPLLDPSSNLVIQAFQLKCLVPWLLHQGTPSPPWVVQVLSLVCSLTLLTLRTKQTGPLWMLWLPCILQISLWCAFLDFPYAFDSLPQSLFLRKL